MASFSKHTKKYAQEGKVYKEVRIDKSRIKFRNRDRLHWVTEFNLICNMFIFLTLLNFWQSEYWKVVVNIATSFISYIKSML